MKKSEYGVQLAEKQKAKYTYGILERQFSNMFKKANSKSGITFSLSHSTYYYLQRILLHRSEFYPSDFQKSTLQYFLM